MTAIRITLTAAGATEPVHLYKARTFLPACLQLLSTIKEKRSSASLARLAGTAWVTESARALDASPFAVLALSELWKSTLTTIWSATAECERMSTDRSSRCAHGRARSRLIATVSSFQINPCRIHNLGMMCPPLRPVKNGQYIATSKADKKQMQRARQFASGEISLAQAGSILQARWGKEFKSCPTGVSIPKSKVECTLQCDAGFVLGISKDNSVKR